MRKPLLAIAGLGVAAALSVPAPASADPKGVPFPVSCDNGITYSAVVMGNGLFQPGHDVDSSTMLIPTAFGEFHGIVTDSSGAVLEEFHDPPVAKGNATKPRATSTNCTFVITDQFEDPDLGLLTFTGSGTVTGFVTPVR